MEHITHDECRDIIYKALSERDLKPLPDTLSITRHDNDIDIDIRTECGKRFTKTIRIPNDGN